MNSDSEVAFREDDPGEEDRKEPALPTHVTTNELSELLKSWDEKFNVITECLRKTQMNADRISSDLCVAAQDSRGQKEDQERRLENMQEELNDFMRRVEMHGTPIAPHALRASTPHRGYPTFGFESSPVNREEVLHPEISTLPHVQSARTEDQGDSMETQMGSARSTMPLSGTTHTVELRASLDHRTRDYDDALRDTRTTLLHISSARTEELRVSRDNYTRDHDDVPRDTPTTLPHTSGARTEDQLRNSLAFRDTHVRNQSDAAMDTHTKEYFDDRRARVRDIQFRLDDRPTRDNDQGSGAIAQQSSLNPGNTSSILRPSSSPKVPTFDGTNTAQFRPWLIQFEAIARHQGWTAGERVVRLVSSLTGPAANLLIGMTMGQLDDYRFLRARLSRRYDPPEREEAHRAELRARTRRRNESADEFAESIKDLAQRAYPLADQNTLDNLVVERFREGHGNEELRKHLCLYPSTRLQDLIGACVRFETHTALGPHARKSNEGLYTLQSGNKNDSTLEEVTRAARSLGFELRPVMSRPQNFRPYNNTPGIRPQNSGSPQQNTKFNQGRNNNVRAQNPIRKQTPIGEVKCWTCGMTGHYAYDCKSTGPKFAFAPKTLKINLLQQIAEQVQEYSEAEQSPVQGNE